MAGRGGVEQNLPPVPRRALVAEVLSAPSAARGAHPGLLFDRYLPIWQRVDSEWEVDRRLLPSAVKLLRRHDPQLLQEIHHRLDRLLPPPAAGGRRPGRAEWPTASRLAIGLGADHPLEAGFTLDFTCGVPVLPGSSLKGLCRAWLNLVDPEDRDGRRLRLLGNELEDRQARAGDLVFLPAYPLAPEKEVRPLLELDILNPHLPGYYREAQEGRGHPVEPVPTDNPVPINFLAVPAGVTFVFRLLARPDAPATTVGEGLEVLAAALADLGVGAKTALGYGTFHTKTQS